MARQKLYLPRSALTAVLVHVIVFGLFVIGYQMKPKVSRAMVDPVNIVQAEVIDGAAIEQEKNRIKQAQEARARKKREERLRRQRQAEEKKRRQQAAKRKQEAARQAQIKAAREQQRQAQQEARRQAQARQQAEQAKQEAEQAKQKAERAKQEAEQARRQAEIKAEQARKRAEENARKLAQALKKQEQARQRAEQQAEQKRLQSILEQEEAAMQTEQEQLARAARQRQLNTLLSQYIGAITAKITSQWRVPPGVEIKDVYCKVSVRQVRGGYIEEVVVRECRIDSEPLRKSVEEAVWKSDPLPTPSSDELFHPQLSITFDPQ